MGAATGTTPSNNSVTGKNLPPLRRVPKRAFGQTAFCIIVICQCQARAFSRVSERDWNQTSASSLDIYARSLPVSVVVLTAGSSPLSTARETVLAGMPYVIATARMLSRLCVWLNGLPLCEQ